MHIFRNCQWINAKVKKDLYLSKKDNKIIDKLKLVQQYNNGISKNRKFDNETNQPSKFRTRNWIEINDESRGTYPVNKQIKFKTPMLRSSLCDYADAYILVKGNITVNNTAVEDAAANNAAKK